MEAPSPKKVTRSGHGGTGFPTGGAASLPALAVALLSSRAGVALPNHRTAWCLFVPLAPQGAGTL